MDWQRSQEKVLFWFLSLWLMVCLCLWWYNLRVSFWLLAVWRTYYNLPSPWGPAPVTQGGVNLPETGKITAFTACCIRVCSCFYVCETIQAECVFVCVSFYILYVTAAVSQLLSSFPESLIQQLLGYCRAVKVSYCVFVSADGWAPIFIQAQEWVAK